VCRKDVTKRGMIGLVRLQGVGKSEALLAICMGRMVEAGSFTCVTDSLHSVSERFLVTFWVGSSGESIRVFELGSARNSPNTGLLA